MNNSSTKKFTKAVIAVAGLLIAFCLVLSAMPTLTTNVLPVASAAEYSINSSSVSEINSKLSGYSSGSVVNVTLTGDITLTNTDLDQFSTGITGISVPSGITVNLYLNSHSIIFDRPEKGAWQLPFVYGIVNRGTLNVYSGSSANSKNAAAPSDTASSIYLVNKRNGMKANAANEECYNNLECIRNYGTLTVNKNVTLYAETLLVYTDNGNSCEGSTTCAATAINQIGAAAKATIDTAKLTLSSDSQGWTSASRRGHSRAYTYGVYGGNVTILGKTDISMYAYTFSHTSSTSGGDHTARNNVVAFGVATTGKVEIYGGSITWNAIADCNPSNGGIGISPGKACENGYQRVYSGAVVTDADNVMIADGTFKSATSKQINSPMGTMVIAEGTILNADRIPNSGEAFLAAVAGDSRSDNDYPTGVFKAGSFVDEANNTYKGTMSTTNETHPTPIIDGATQGVSRVHVIYRYWLEEAKNNIDTSVTGSTGLVGYSYLPLGDGTDIVKTKATFTGFSGANVYTKVPASGITYTGGAAVNNSNYYQLKNVAYAMPTGEFSDINFTAATNKGIVMNGAVGQDISTPIYIFVDYYRLTPTTIRGNVGAGDAAVATYTGSPILASDIGFKITNSTGSKDFTADYNIDKNNSSKIEVEYSYTGTTAAGDSESGSGLPVNAGTYSVTAHVDDQTDYNKDATLYKNRKALDYTFTLTVNPAPATRGNLPESVSLVYGTKLGEKLAFSTYSAKGINGEGNQNGVFTFTTSSDGTGYKNVGTGTVQVTWTPAASVTNYTTTTFTVNYTVTKAALRIIPNAASVAYGETVFDTPFTATFEGLTGNDDNAAVKQTITNSLSFMISKGGSWVAYTPDQVGAGTYPIRATFEGALPEVMNNYTYTYVFGADENPYGNLTVSPRALTVKATAVSREYDKDSYAVNVTFTIEEGRYSVDDINVATAIGSVANNNVGFRTVNGIDKAKVQASLSGGAAANYVVGEVIYATGNDLTVEITKANPVVGVPTTDERYYQMTATLADVAINAAASSVEGTWQWVDANINPTVAVKTYQAKFVPNDSVNYGEKVVDVTVNVKPTPVVISYEKTVEYGDKKPNITDFTYTAAQDPSFSFDRLDCEGNISVSTTYEQGKPVSATGYPVVITATNYVDKGGNYTFTVKNGTIYVTKRTVTFRVQNVEITYGSNFVLNNSTVTVVADENSLYGSDTINSVTANGDAPTFTFTSDYSAQTNYNAGVYYISAHNNFTTSANYDVAFVDGTLTVNKADLVISAKPITVEYNTEITDAQLASSYTVTGAKKNETLAQMMTEGTIGVDTTYYKGAVVNAEGYPVTVDVSGCKFPNYNVTVNNSVITVVKATPVIEELPSATLVHNQTLSQAVFTGGSIQGNIPGTFAFNSGNTSVVYSGTPYTYPATFVPEDTANYNTVAIPGLTLVVSKLAVTGDLAISGIAMKGETLTVDVSGLNPDEIGVYSFSWTVDGVEIATGTSYSVTDADVDKVITVTATANGYYEGSKQAVTSKVTPKLTSVATILDSNYANYFVLGGLDAYKGTTTVEYDAVEHIVSFVQSNASLANTSIGAVTVKYNGSTQAPVNAGYYTVTIDVGTPAYTSIDTKNGVTFDPVANKYVYSSISGYVIGTLYIAPKDYTVTLTFADKVYDGNRNTTATYTEAGACTLPGGAKDAVAYNASAAVYSFADANVGTGKTVNVTGAALTGASASNYNLVVVKAGDGKAAVTARTLKASVEPVSRPYEKNNYTVYLGFTVDASSLAPTDSLTQVYVDDTNAYGIIDDYTAGTRFVTVYDAALAGSKAGNYVLELTNETNLTVEITKAVPSYPIPSTGTVYYNSAKTLSEISLGYDNWQWDESVRNTVPTAGVHYYKAVFTPNDAENEATVEYNVKLIVNKAPVTIRIASFNNVVYGDNVPTYYYTATGLTGTDTIKKDVDGYILLESNYTAGSPVGTYAIVRSGEFESDNYSFIYVSGSITVNPRTVYTTAAAVSRPYEPGNKSVDVNFSELSNIYAGDNSGVYLASTTVTGTVATDGAGTKKVTYTAPALAGDKAENYKLFISNSNLTVDITKAVLTDIDLPASGTITFGQKLSATVFDEPYDAKGLGSFTMESPSSTPDAVGVFSTGYNVIFTPTDSANYAQIIKPITLTVKTAVLSGVAVQIAGNTQVGKVLYASVGNVPASALPYVTYNWYRVDNASDSYRDGYMFASGRDSITLTDSEQGKYIIAVAVAKDGAPFEISGEARTDESIKAESLSFWQRLIKWFYKILSGFTQLFGRIG